MKKTLEFENKIIMIADNDYLEKTEYSTFEEAYEAMKHRYVDEEGFWWDVEDWEEDYSFEKVKAKFETDGYVRFCDRDEITTTEAYLIQALLEID